MKLRKGKAPKDKPARCRRCKRPERTSCGGLLTNLSPYGRLCTDCINSMSPAQVLRFYGYGS